MTEDESVLSQWLEGYRANELTEAQRRQLEKKLREDNAFKKGFTNALADATSLDVFFSATDLTHHHDCIRDATALERQSRRLREVSAVRRRTSNNHRQRMPLAKAWLAAAIICIGLGLLALHQFTYFTASSQQKRVWSLATVERLTGTVELNGIALAAGPPPTGHGRLSVTGTASLMLNDGTHLQVQGPSHLSVHPAGPIAIEQAQLQIAVAKQSAGYFSVATPHGNINVLGTEFALHTDQNATVVALHEGIVATGTGTAQKTWRSPTLFQLDHNEASALPAITIHAGQGRITDPQWTLQNDRNALSGQAWVLSAQPDNVGLNETATNTALARNRGLDLWVPALAGVPYRIWIRTRCDLPPEQKNRLRHDNIVLSVPGGRVTSRPKYPSNRIFPEGPQLTSFSGSGVANDYVWVGGWADRSLHNQVDAVTIVFDQPGLQNLQIITYEGPLRIDAIRLVAQGGRDPVH